MKEKILVVQNDWLKRHWVDTRLEEQGYEVLTAADEIEFWQQAFDPELAVIVLDIHRRNRLGADIYRALLDFGMNRNVPIIFTTGLAEDGRSQEEIIRDENYTFISKPVDFKTLCREIERFHRKPIEYGKTLDKAG